MQLALWTDSSRWMLHDLPNSCAVILLFDCCDMVADELFSEHASSAVQADIDVQDATSRSCDAMSALKQQE